ncbi:hypothetical protein EST38_g258 [Candolleomyces aberdarensis]|uniref:Cwf15/Cwc15 cell cycle control protein n=1 Tax=Candolleomyces aberdarensis TaxID=2316362 RepID=A0A4Q2E0G1_9AGAR|nr:hypothetical protein EST38_g258 [Candolleomyces aberdarensis]
MSTAHRPTWDPAQAKDSKAGSRQYSVRDMAAHTKLKFRQVGQTSVTEVRQRDLRAELLSAEREAQNKKRKAEGKPPLPEEGSSKPIAAIENGAASDEANKRRKLLQEALELDKDDSDEEDEDEGKGKKKAVAGDDDDDEDEDERLVSRNLFGVSNERMSANTLFVFLRHFNSEEEDSDEEDETAELMRELEKIKRERAEEKARQEREQSESNAVQREAEIATANPLLNLAAALGQSPDGLNTTAPGSFQVKRRWDDDLIFKNQAANMNNKGQGFVNDLLRTEFHKKFMSKFIK